jgi:hypothetical protein
MSSSAICLPEGSCRLDLLAKKFYGRLRHHDTMLRNFRAKTEQRAVIDMPGDSRLALVQQTMKRWLEIEFNIRFHHSLES